MVKQAWDLDIPGNWCTAQGIFHIPGMVITGVVITGVVTNQGISLPEDYFSSSEDDSQPYLKYQENDFRGSKINIISFHVVLLFILHRVMLLPVACRLATFPQKDENLICYHSISTSTPSRNSKQGDRLLCAHNHVKSAHLHLFFHVLHS